MNRVVLSSTRHDWATPRRLFAALDAEFGFTLDPCALPENATCDRYFTPDDDGLSQAWDGVAFCNPPFGSDIGKWVKKAFDEAQRGSTVVALVPARTDTSWWHRYVMKASEVRLIRGRLQFIGCTKNAPFPSCVVVFRPGEHAPMFSAMDRLLDEDPA